MSHKSSWTYKEQKKWHLRTYISKNYSKKILFIYRTGITRLRNDDGNSPIHYQSAVFTEYASEPLVFGSSECFSLLILSHSSVVHPCSINILSYAVALCCYYESSHLNATRFILIIMCALNHNTFLTPSLSLLSGC